MNSGGSENHSPQCFWMHMIIPRNGILAVKDDGMNLKQYDFATNNLQYASKVGINQA
jgi:hypothetical protein